MTNVEWKFSLETGCLLWPSSSSFLEYQYDFSFMENEVENSGVVFSKVTYPQCSASSSTKPPPILLVSIQGEE